MAVHDRTRLTGLLTFFKAGKSDVFWKNHKVIFDYLFKSSYMPV